MRNRRLLFIAFATLAVGSAVVYAGGQQINSVIGNVFLQDTTPGTAQAGHANISGTFRAGAITASNSNASSVPVIGNQTAVSGTTYGGSFSAASPDGTAIRGTATSTQNFANTGVLGVSRGTYTYSAGVKGTGRMGVYGLSDQPNGMAGYFYTNQAGGKSVYAQAGPSAPTAIYATGAPTTNYDSVLYVNASGATGNAEAAHFVAANNNGYGLWVESTATSGSTASIITENASTSGIGVYGIIAANSTGVALYGYQTNGTSTGTAVAAHGDLTVSGNKQFRIDHPLDPEHQYLNHFCTEGPAPYNAYRGNVKLDGKGAATVKLPDYFDAINIDPSYTLTAIGASMPGLYIAGKVQNNMFRIGGGKPGGEVSWCVTGVRNDRFEQAYGYKTEMRKPQSLQGTYVDPELYGKPAKLQEHADIRRGN